MNPSINDYLFSELTTNVNEQIAIIENAVYYEQILKALESDAAISYYQQKMFSYNYLELSTLENISFSYFLESIIDLQILVKSLKRKVVMSLERAYTNLSYRSKEEYGKINTCFM